MKRTIPICAAIAGLATLAAAVGVGPAYATESATAEALFDYTVVGTAPTLASGGLRFDGTAAGGRIVGLSHAEQAVALSSLTGLGYTIATAPAAGDADPAYALSVATTGTTTDATLTAEPGDNGQAVNAQGAFDVSAWKFSSSQLGASDDGGAGDPEPLSWFAGQ